MVVRGDGSYECALSGGCLEPAVADAAQRVLRTGEPLTATYDLADDSLWGLGIGCMGAVDIRIERLDADPLVDQWLVALERGEAAALVTPLAGASGRLLVRADAVLGVLSDATVSCDAVARARERLRDPQMPSGAEAIGGAELFFDISRPAPPLVIFGAGYDAEPLARQAWTVGFAVTVVDAREAFLSADRFPGAALVRAHFTEFRERIPLDSTGFVVIMNHHVERDRESLRFALESPASYVGVLGPRARYDLLMAELTSLGFAPDPARTGVVRSPVGLALGAETPDEVAMSIVSEMLALRRGFAGGFLAGSRQSLHRLADARLFARS